MAEVELPDPEELAEKRDRAFSRRVALTTAIYAVVLAIASLGGNNAMKEMLLAQQEATNQWAYYQAKVIREHLNRGNKLLMETQLAEPSGIRAAERPKFESLARKFADEEKRMAADKKDIEKEARKFESLRDGNQTKDPYFDYAEVLLQIAIVTASVSILSNSRSMFWFSMALAIGGALLTLDGFTLLVRIPVLHAH
ncbi:MAG: DUF4337 domain-containing protein [Candidatus Rokubacteria bacterium]|nr:DUF4337 domain-containing protein [Candidatus Rokubacteria bacterium]